MPVDRAEWTVGLFLRADAIRRGGVGEVDNIEPAAVEVAEIADAVRDEEVVIARVVLGIDEPAVPLRRASRARRGS